MAGIDPARDPRGAHWEQRLRLPVLVAAWLALPTVFLYFSDLTGATAAVAVALSWLIWAVFLVEAVVMLSVVRDRPAWIRGHLFGLAILVATFPLLTKALEALLAARALSGLQAIRILQVLYLAKAAKLIKGLLVVKNRGAAPRHPVLIGSVLAFLAATFIGIVDRVVTGDKHSTPLHGFVDLVADLPRWSLAVSLGALVSLAVLAVAGRQQQESG